MADLRTQIEDVLADHCPGATATQRYDATAAVLKAVREAMDGLQVDTDFAVVDFVPRLDDLLR